VAGVGPARRARALDQLVETATDDVVTSPMIDGAHGVLRWTIKADPGMSAVRRRMTNPPPDNPARLRAQPGREWARRPVRHRDPAPGQPAHPGGGEPGGGVPMNHAFPHTATQHTQASDGQAEILDLDEDVPVEHTASITAWLPVEREPRHVVDLGCGTGAGTFALLARFPEAEVTAVDASAGHLDRLRGRAEALGVADRVRTVQADLDADWPDLGRPELVWASASTHHMADPGRTLREVRDPLAPGGLFAVVEGEVEPAPPRIRVLRDLRGVVGSLAFSP
jgi:hypothetical protein